MSEPEQPEQPSNVGSRDEAGRQSIAIGELAHVRAGNGFPHRLQGRSSGTYPFFKVSDMNARENGTWMSRAVNYVEEADVRELRATVMPPNTVVFPKVGAAIATNKKRILAQSSLVDNNVMGVTVHDSEVCEPEFLLRWFQTLDLRELSNPGPLPSITAGAVKAAMIDLPPPVEQRAIAHVLHAVQRAKEQTEQVIGAARELKRSLMRHLFTYGPIPINRSSSTELQITELGTLPTHWTVVSLEDIQADSKYAMTAGPFGSKLGQKDYVADGVPVLRGRNLVGGRNIVLGDLVFVSEQKADELASSIARPGDVVVTQRGSLGLAAMIPSRLPYQRYVVSQSQMKFTSNRLKAIPEFVLYALQTDGAQQRIQDSAVRSGVPHINLGIFRAFKIPLPPLPEQETIVDCLDAMSVKIEAEERRRDALNALFDSLLHGLMTAGLRVDPLVAEFAR